MLGVTFTSFYQNVEWSPISGTVSFWKSPITRLVKLFYLIYLSIYFYFRWGFPFLWVLFYMELEFVREPPAFVKCYIYFEKKVEVNLRILFVQMIHKEKERKLWKNSFPCQIEFFTLMQSNGITYRLKTVHANNLEAWDQVFLLNTNNLYTELFDTYRDSD